MDVYSKARDLGIELEFQDGQGNRHQVSAERVRAILDGLPLPARHPYLKSPVVIAAQSDDFRIATDPAARIRAIVEVSGGIPESSLSAVGPNFPPTLIVHGDVDTVVPVSMAYQLKELLGRHRVPFQGLILPGQGHWFDPAAQLQILMATAGFLVRHL